MTSPIDDQAEQCDDEPEPGKARALRATGWGTEAVDDAARPVRSPGDTLNVRQGWHPPGGPF